MGKRCTTCGQTSSNKSKAGAREDGATHHLPGTRGKILAMSGRESKQLPLFHRDDATPYVCRCEEEQRLRTLEDMLCRIAEGEANLEMAFRD